MASTRSFGGHGLVRYATHPSCIAVLRTLSLSLPVMKMMGRACPALASRLLSSIPDIPLSWMSKTMQLLGVLQKVDAERNASADEYCSVTKPRLLSNDAMLLSIAGSSSMTTTTLLRFGKAIRLHQAYDRLGRPAPVPC